MEPQIDLSSLPVLSVDEALRNMRQQGMQFYPVVYPAEKQIFNISLEEFKQLVNAQVDITALYLLECVASGIDIVKEIPSSKVKGWYQTLQRRGYISQEGTISQTGKELLEMVKAGKQIKLELAKIEAKQEDGFERWWSHFPANDIFEHKGKKFSGQRSLRSDKPKCRGYFDKIINEGEYTVDDMIRALNYEVTLKKEASVKEGDNKMKYLSASTAYLNQRKFEAFMEVSKNVPIAQANPNNYSGFDI